MKPLVSLRAGGFSYGQRVIFSGLDLALAPGDLMCLLGPNGCGKTTLLRCLCGVLQLQEGQAAIDGRDISEMSETERARSLGFVFQEHSIHFPYAVRDVVLMGRSPHLAFLAMPSRRDGEVADRALEMVGMADQSHRRYTEISGGERQLVLLARALTQQPRILLLDEPTSHLDFGNQMLILDTIRRLVHEQHLTVIMATHFPDHALLVSNQVVLMKDGGFVAAGSPQQVVTEDNLRRLYGVNVRVVSMDQEDCGRTTAVVPLLQHRIEESRRGVEWAK